MTHRSIAIGFGIACLGAALAACSSSSSGGAGAPDSGSGSGSGSGGSSGSSSGGTSSGSGGGSGGSSGGGSGGSSGGASGSSSGGTSGGDKVLASGQTHLDGMLIAGSSLFWVIPQSGIMSVPLAGGTPTMIYANPSIDEYLGSDGSALYFAATNTSGAEVDSVGLDGTGEKQLVSGVFDFGGMNDCGPQIFVVGGTVYINASSNILSVPTSGGSAGMVLSGNPPVALALLWADSSGIYFEGAGDLYWVPVTGGAAQSFYTFSIASPIQPGQLTVVGGTAYFVVNDSSNSGVLMKSTAGSAATTVTTYSGENLHSGGIASDGNGGLYEFGSGGIASAVASTGAQTILESGLQNEWGQNNAVDATHIVYGTTGFGISVRAR